MSAEFFRQEAAQREGERSGAGGRPGFEYVNNSAVSSKISYNQPSRFERMEREQKQSSNKREY